MSDTALQVQQGTLATLLSDPDRLREFPIETVERMFDLERQFRADAARDAFFAAFGRVQARMAPVAKRGQIDFGRGKPAPYALAADVMAMLAPLLIEEGFSHSVSEGDSPDGMTRFVLTLRHTGGHVETHHMDVPAGSGKGGTMSAIQAMASTYTYCQRHLLVKVFGVIVTDDDDGAEVNGREKISESQLADLLALIDEVKPGPGFVVFLKDVFDVEQPDEISVADYPKVCRALEQKRRAKA